MACEQHRRIFVAGTDLRSSAQLDAVALRHTALVYRFPSRQDCLRQLRVTPCDVLILDLGGPVENLHMIAQARQLWPWQSSIVFVARGEVGHAVAAMKAGAIDCLEKPIRDDHLLSAVEQGLRRTAALFVSHPSLTRMELIVLQRILAGKTSKDIASEVNRSKRTIDVHREKIYRKVGVSNTLAIVKWAMSAGIMDCLGKTHPNGNTATPAGNRTTKRQAPSPGAGPLSVRPQEHVGGPIPSQDAAE